MGPHAPIGTARRWLAGWLPLWVYTALVLKGAVAQPHEIPSIFFILNDKIVHAVEYFFLFWFAAHAFGKAKTLALRAHAGRGAMIYGLALGALTELLQRVVPERSCDFWDWVADAGGLGLAFAVSYAWQARGRRP